MRERDPRPAAQPRRHHDPRDPRPDRGDDDGRPGHLHEQGPHRADRHRGRSLPPARTACSSPASSARRRSTCCRARRGGRQVSRGRGARCRCAGRRRRRGRASASGRSMCAWARATSHGRIEDLRAAWPRDDLPSETPLGPLRALEAGAVARFRVGDSVPLRDRFDACCSTPPSGRRIAGHEP